MAAALALFGLIGRATAPLVPANTWSATGDMTEARAGASAALMADGHVLVSGGTGDAGVTASAERYSSTAGGFVQTAPMRGARATHTSTLLPDGRVLVAGGIGVDGEAVASAEIYDASTPPSSRQTNTTVSSGSM